MTNKIALLVDSAMDVPQEILDLEGVYVLPLNIIYKEGTYLDKIDISPKEVFDRLDTEIPKTSLPTLEYIQNTVSKIKKDGYENILAMSVSSGLSGTFNAVRLILEENTDINHRILDTKSVGLGCGIQAAYIKNLIDKNYSLESLYEIGIALTHNEHVFMSIPTLEYLKKGGRVGLISSVVGTALNLHPIISCNEEGIYYTAAKVRGRNKSIQRLVELARPYVESAKEFHLAVSYGTCEEEALTLMENLKKEFPHYSKLYMSPASPVLGVHSGPGIIGVSVLVLN